MDGGWDDAPRSERGALGASLDHRVGERVEVEIEGERHEAEVTSARWESYGTAQRYEVRVTWGPRAGETHDVDDSCSFV